MTPDQGFLQAILASPDDDTHRLVYADWLDERGDPRGRYLRAEVQLAALTEEDPAYAAREAELQALREGLDPTWLILAGKRYDLYLESYEPSRKILVIKLIREATWMGLKEAKELSESVPATVPGPGLSRQEAERARDTFRGYAAVGIRPAPDRAGPALEDQRRTINPGGWLAPGGWNLCLESYLPWQRGSLIQAIHEVTGLSLEAAVELTSAGPCVLVPFLSWDDAVAAWLELRPLAAVSIRPSGV
jgi:uncharacterized protein (TIGR02996 family)